MSLFGLLNLNKPTGVTSRDVVNRVARLVRPAKVGHAGTLDPLASGVLVIGVGQATRLVEYVQRMPKGYRATFLLGRTSPTEDIEGEVTLLEHAPTPTPEQVAGVAAALVGHTMQRPPAYSALKVEGRRAYALARAGQDFELAPREIDVYAIKVTRYEYPELELEIECGSGTYVRSLGRDLAERLGSCAVMSALVRTFIGPFTLETAIDPAKLALDTTADRLLPPLLAVRGLMNEREVSAEEIARLLHGLPLAANVDSETAAAAECAAINAQGQLVAILTRCADGRLAPSKVFLSS